LPLDYTLLPQPSQEEADEVIEIVNNQNKKVKLLVKRSPFFYDSKNKGKIQQANTEEALPVDIDFSLRDEYFKQFNFASDK